MLYDPYERINVWSHGVPGVTLVLLGAAAAAGLAPGGAPLAAFCACAAVTHLFSAITHVWPDSHALVGLFKGFGSLGAWDAEAAGSKWSRAQP